MDFESGCLIPLRDHSVFLKEARITVSNLDKQVAIRRDVLDGPRALLPAQEPETGLGTMEERILQADPPIKGSTGTECTRSDESARHGQGSFHQDLKTTAIRIRTALSANAGWSSLKRREAARRYIAVYLLSIESHQMSHPAPDSRHPKAKQKFISS